MKMLYHGFANKSGKYNLQSASRLASEDDLADACPS